MFTAAEVSSKVVQVSRVSLSDIPTPIIPILEDEDEDEPVTVTAPWRRGDSKAPRCAIFDLLPLLPLRLPDSLLPLRAAVRLHDVRFTYYDLRMYDAGLVAGLAAAVYSIPSAWSDMQCDGRIAFF